MKTIYITVSFLLYSFVLIGQENETSQQLFKTDSTWLEEIIKFPLSFAPEITFEGYEDLRFDKDWSKKERPGFWSIVYAWKITNNKEQSIMDIETNLKRYYDGLMKAVNKDKDYQVPATQITLIKNKSSDKKVDYTGTIALYDSFWSKTVMTLNIRLKNHYCKATRTSLIVFRISPQAFDAPVWKKLNSVNLHKDVCE